MLLSEEVYLISIAILQQHQQMQGYDLSVVPMSSKGLRLALFESGDTFGGWNLVEGPYANWEHVL